MRTPPPQNSVYLVGALYFPVICLSSMVIIQAKNKTTKKKLTIFLSQ